MEVLTQEKGRPGWGGGLPLKPMGNNNKEELWKPNSNNEINKTPKKQPSHWTVPSGINYKSERNEHSHAQVYCTTLSLSIHIPYLPCEHRALLFETSKLARLGWILSSGNRGRSFAKASAASSWLWTSKDNAPIALRREKLPPISVLSTSRDSYTTGNNNGRVGRASTYWACYQ